MLTREEFDRLRQEDPEALWRILAEFAQRVLALEEKIAPKPHTPSAAQGFLKPMSQRPKTERKTGGQKGHKGHTLEKNEIPDEVQQHKAAKCPTCGLDLKDVSGEVVETRQVMDLPEVIRFFTTEHQVLEVCCPGCQSPVKADFPAEVTAPVQYGPHTQTTCTLLKVDQAISLERIVSFFTDWFGHAPSEGTIQNWIHRAATTLEPIEEQIKQGIIQASAAGFDETMVRSCKKNTWIHVARTDKLTHCAAPGGRGKITIEKIGILPYFRGVAHHDAWGAYFSFQECGHSLCNAHLVREGAALKERFDAKGTWSEPIICWLLEVKKRRDSGVLSCPEKLVSGLRAVVKRGYAALGFCPPDEGVKLSACSKEFRSRIRWLDRLWFYAPYVVRFGWDALACFDNNGSERDIRPVKLFAKVFGCWRSASGLASFCRLRGYLSTLRKQGISPREGLLSVFRGSPIVPATI
jgi:transposase